MPNFYNDKSDGLNSWNKLMDPDYRRLLGNLSEKVGVEAGSYDYLGGRRHYGQDPKPDRHQYEKDIISAANNNYSFRTAMQYANKEKIPKSLDSIEDVWKVKQYLRKTHAKDGGTDFGDDENNDVNLANAAQSIFEKNRDKFKSSILSDSGKNKSKKPKIPSYMDPSKPIQLSNSAAKDEATVSAWDQRFDSGFAQPSTISSEVNNNQPSQAAFDLKNDYSLNLRSGMGTRGQTFTFKHSGGWDGGTSEKFLDDKKKLITDNLQPGWNTTTQGS